MMGREHDKSERHHQKQYFNFCISPRRANRKAPPLILVHANSSTFAAVHGAERAVFSIQNKNQNYDVLLDDDSCVDISICILFSVIKGVRPVGVGPVGIQLSSH